MIPAAATAIELWPCHYRAQCTEPGCRYLARIIVRFVADGGSPEGQRELCNRDARKQVEALKAKGMPVHDMRT